MSKINQRDVTRNQSTLDMEHTRLFIFNNTYQKGILLNNTSSDLIVKSGLLLLRNPADALQVIPAINDASLAEIIGITAMDSDTIVAAGETLNIHFATQGDVDAKLLSLPEGTTLDTIPDGTKRTIADILHSIGFHLRSITDNTKFDN